MCAHEKQGARINSWQLMIHLLFYMIDVGSCSRYTYVHTVTVVSRDGGDGVGATGRRGGCRVNICQRETTRCFQGAPGSFPAVCFYPDFRESLTVFMATKTGKCFCA